MRRRHHSRCAEAAISRWVYALQQGLQASARQTKRTALAPSAQALNRLGQRGNAASRYSQARPRQRPGRRERSPGRPATRPPMLHSQRRGAVQLNSTAPAARTSIAHAKAGKPNCSGSENHSGAERPELRRKLNGQRAQSGLAGRWRGTGRTRHATAQRLGLHPPAASEHLHKPGLGTLDIAVGERMAASSSRGHARRLRTTKGTAPATGA